MDQDDLLVLHHLRAAWAGGETQAAAAKTLTVCPGRAEGRVAAWALDKAAGMLAHASRRRLRIGGGLAPSADEAQLLRVARALAANDWQSAEDAGLWLVRRDAAPALAQALAPAACALYGRAAPRRRNAARA